MSPEDAPVNSNTSRDGILTHEEGIRRVGTPQIFLRPRLAIGNRTPTFTLPTG